MRAVTTMFVLAVTLLPQPSWAQTHMIPATGDAPTLIVTGQGQVSRTPDLATVNLSILTNDDVSTAATSKNNEIYESLKAKLAPLGLDDTRFKTLSFNVSYNPRPNPLPEPRSPAVGMSYPIQFQPRFGYVVSRIVALTIVQVGSVGKVVDAAIAAGATNVSGVQYGLMDRKTAYNAALTAAMEDAASQAAVAANAGHFRLAGVKQIQVGQNYAMPVPAAPMRMSAPGVPTVPTDIPPASVDVRASATVTYFLKP